MKFILKDGKNIGEFKDGVFYKEVKLSKHFHKIFNAWGIPVEVIEKLRKEDCHTIRFAELEEGCIWETPFEMFEQKSWVRQFEKYEPQKFLAKNRWNIRKFNGEQVQTMKPLDEPQIRNQEAKNIEDEYAKLKTDFKPQFGNENHINVVKGYDEIIKLEKELEKKEKASKGAETLRKDIIARKKNIIFWMKKV